MKDRIKREKKFIGGLISSIVGSAANVVGNIIGAKEQKKAMEQQMFNQQAQVNLNNASQEAANLSQVYNTQNDNNDIMKKASLAKYGTKKQSTYDRIKFNRMKCGGKHRK